MDPIRSSDMMNKRIWSRYRTTALVGRWHLKQEKALQDAIKAGLVQVGDANQVHWLVQGGIEQSPHAPKRRQRNLH